MDNFVFSSNLEIGIIEYRLQNLFRYINETGVIFFYPALVFNESFWICDIKKRLSIFANQQFDWSGSNPINKTYFFYDPYLIEIVKSLKVSLFSYSKIDLPGLIDILKAKNKFSITDFAEFGDIDKSPIKFVNKVFPIIDPSIEDDEEDSKLIGKIIAIKVFKFISEVEKFDLLYINGNENFGIIDEFIHSLEVIETNKNIEVFSKINIVILNSDGIQTKKIDEIVNSKKFRSILIDVFDPINFSLKSKYDYIIFDHSLSCLPIDIIQKYDKVFYSLSGRLVSRNRVDVEKVIEYISILQSPINDFKGISKSDIDELDLEMSWGIYSNQRVIDLINNLYTPVEGKIYKISLTVLKILVEAIKNTNTERDIHIIDYFEDTQSDNSLFSFKKINNRFRTAQSIDLYKTILQSFNDISIEINDNKINYLIKSELNDDQDEFIMISSFLSFLNKRAELSKEFFDIENFQNSHKLKTIDKKFSKYLSINNSSIPSFGLGKKVFAYGINKIKNYVKNDNDFATIIDKLDSLKDKNISSFSKGIIVLYISDVLENLEKNKSKLISKNLSSQKNEFIIQLLKSNNIIPDKFIRILNTYWNEILNYSEKVLPERFIEISVCK